MKLISFKKPVEFSGFTLVIPTVSVGNVPQLTIDVLITTLELESVATLWQPALVSCVGADPFDANSKDLCTQSELYVNPARKLATIQLRSTIELRAAKSFFTELIQSVSELRFKEVYVLGTGFDYELHNIANKNTYYFVSSNPHISTSIENISLVKPLEVNVDGRLNISGSGFAVKLYESLKDKVPTTLVVKYVSEGENTTDAFNLLFKLLEFLGLDSKKLQPKIPDSWQFVYGAPPPLGLF